MGEGASPLPVCDRCRHFVVRAEGLQTCLPCRKGYQLLVSLRSVVAPNRDEAAAVFLEGCFGLLEDWIKEIKNLPVAADASSTPAVDQRFSKLEAGLKEVRAQGDQFQKWFTQANQRMTQQEQATHALKGALEGQQQELGVLRQDVKQTGIQVETQLASLRNDLGSHLDDKIDSAMQRFEALLSKKQRTED